jgi:HAD superfamily hydrolase (TIGR01662 family)
MKLFLPSMGWHVKFTKSLEELPERLSEQLEEDNTNILEEPEDEAVLYDRVDVDKYVKKKVTEWVRPLYFWTSYDPVPFPENAQGEEIETCMGHSLVFHDRDECLRDLAKVHEPVAWLLELNESGPTTARPLARSVLEGDRDALHILADALEEADHPRAKEIRDLAKEEGKPKKKSKKPVTRTAPGQGPPPAGPKYRLQVQSPGGVFNVAFIPHSTRFALVGYSDVEVCEVKDAKKVHTMTGPGYCGRCLAVSPDGRLIAATENDGEWMVYEATTGRELSGRYTRSPIRGLAFSPDGTRIASISQNGTLGVWNPLTGATIALEHGGEGAPGLAFTPSGALVTVLPGQIAFFFAGSAQRSRSIALPGVPRAFALSPDGQLIAVAFEDRSLAIVDNQPEHVGLRLTTTANAHAMAFSPDGALLAVGDVAGSITLFDVASGQVRFSGRLHAADTAVAVTFSPDGIQLGTAAEDTFCRLWNVADFLTATPATTEKVPATPASGRTASAVAQEVVLIGGFPASGKSTYTRSFVERGYERLNRDEMGGSMEKLLGPLEELLDAGKAVVLDNLYATKESRSPFVKLARRRDIPIRFLLMETGLEDAQFNASLRMMEKAGRLLHPDDHKKAEYKKDPGLFPVFVIYKYKKDFEKPTTGEGFAAVETVPFTRTYPADWTNKAIVLDIDGTVRTTTGSEKYPTKPSEVKAFKERAAKLKKLQKEGYLLVGASNQSGIAKGKLTKEAAEACFAETQKQLGVKFETILYCPHSVPPIACYCRKPNPGLGVELMWRYKLDPRQCICVGDMGTDRSFAERCGFTFVDQEEFFK